MSDAARLARQMFLTKPRDLTYMNFTPSEEGLASVKTKTGDATLDAAYSAAISYTEALAGLKQRSISWSIVKLYYSCFYSLKALLLLKGLVPFNCKGEMVLNIPQKEFIKGGTSSHHWNWTSLRKIQRIKGEWFLSSDSEEAYKSLREHRENANYTHPFTDPDLHACLASDEHDLGKRFRRYRDDNAFFYTYLSDHLTIVYPTKLIFSLDARLKDESITLDREKINHIKRIWNIKDRCPIT